jgi:hypothetical protein
MGNKTQGGDAASAAAFKVRRAFGAHSPAVAWPSRKPLPGRPEGETIKYAHQMDKDAGTVADTLETHPPFFRRGAPRR